MKNVERIIEFTETTKAFLVTKRGFISLNVSVLILLSALMYSSLWVPAWDIKEDKSIPFEYKWKAAIGDRDVQYQLAIQYDPNNDSQFVKADADKYEKWLLRSAVNGYSSAMTDYILFGNNNYKKGLFAKDLEKYLSDNPRVLHALALLYTNKEFTGYDPYKAFGLVRRAAHMGDYKAMNTLGNWYVDGTTGSTNVLLGAAWIIASGEGSMDSEYIDKCQDTVIAIIREEGFRNPKSVVKVLVKKAEQLLNSVAL